MTYADGSGDRYNEIISSGSCNGWDGNDYYINGVKSSLGESGTGTWNNLYYISGSLYTGYLETTDKYYLGGIVTDLDINGDGCWNSQNYDNGSIVNPPDGYDSCTNLWYIDGMATMLDSSGSGYYNSFAYYNGSIQSTGWNGYHYYIDNVETALDSNGDGYWNDEYYIGGALINVGYTYNVMNLNYIGSIKNSIYGLYYDT
jgi:hypothetical protein